MKKQTILSASILLAAIVTSCSKEAIRQPGTSTTVPPLSTTSTAVKIASSWFSPIFETVNDRSSVYLMANRDHGSALNYDKTSHVELAYIKMNYYGATTIKKIPAILSSSHVIANEFCEISFALDNVRCQIMIKNADRNVTPIIINNPFPDLQVRYIVITKSLFESLSINWDDYAAVAQALNI